MQPALKVVQIQGMSAYSVRSPGPDSCVCIGIGIGEPRLYGFSGYKGGPEPFHISGLHCITKLHCLLRRPFFLEVDTDNKFPVLKKHPHHIHLGTNNISRQ